MRTSPNGTDLTAKVNGHLDYLSQLAKHLGAPDPVESYLVPVLGRWSDLHDEAARWRSAAQVASDVTNRLTAPLAGLDAAWQGADADSFLDYMHTVGLAGHDMADALTGMADALDRTADGIRQIAGELVDMLADTAEQSSAAMTLPAAGHTRAHRHIAELDGPARQLSESVRDVSDAFVKLCQGVQDGQSVGRIAMPVTTTAASAGAVHHGSADLPPPTDPGSTPVTTDSTTDTPAAGGGMGGGMPMGGMGGMGGGRGGDAEHKSKIRISGDPREIFGKPDRTAPPTIGED